MQQKKKFQNPLKNQKGSLTIEMIFGLITAIGVGVVLFVISFSLTTIEIAQYIAFSAARAQAAANRDLNAQVQRGRDKYTNIKDKIFSADAEKWFEFPSANNTFVWNSNWASRFPNDNVLDIGGGQTFPWAPNKGFGFPLTLKILGVKLPVLGSAGDKDSFKTFISALVLRQPTHAECVDFWGPARGMALQMMDPRFQNLGPTAISLAYQNTTAMMTENACGPTPP